MATLGIPQNTIDILKKYDFHFQKKFGQNFLIDTHVLEKIIDAAGVTKDDFVLEIGPGIGTMTQYLCERAREVMAVEIDDKLIPILADTLSAYDNVTVVNEDILKLDIDQIAREHNDGKPIKVVANLPYYITTPIIMKLLEEELDLESITVMIQKEVADRLTAIPGKKNTGAITYTVYYYTDSEEILEVPKDSFIPEPEVTSEVIKLNIRKTPIVEPKNKEKMFKVIKCAFTQRRKTLLNSLVNTNILDSKQQGINMLNSLNINENIRPEELTIEQFKEISDFLS